MNCHDPFYFFLIAFKFINNLFRTPLNGIIGIIDINSKSSDMELIEENRQKARCAAQQLLSLLNEVLDMSRLEHGETVLTNELFHLSELTAALQDTMQIHAADSGIILICDSYTVPSNCERVYGSPIYIQKIFFNIIENAIKYNKEDGWVHVSLNADYQYFYLKVEDSGIGIPEDSLEHIYERFYRVDKSHSREIGGTGLGLAITRNAILMHRGAIKVFSTEGEGTLFTVRIPLNYIA